MKLVETGIKDLVILEPRVFGDARGFFLESYNKKVFNQLLGREISFVQDNMAKSSYGVLRGLHYQTGADAQAKLVSVVTGEVLDVVVDLREKSPTYGKHYSVLLNENNKRQLFVPRGFAHGYVVLSDSAIFHYKCDNFYNPAAEGGLIYNDPSLNIDWNIDLAKAILSEKDKKNPLLGENLPSGLNF